MNILFTNNAKTLLDGAILIDATSIVVDDGSDFPSPTGSQFFYATLQNPADDTDYEIVKCTARSGNTLTVTREQDGTSAQAWTDGTLCELRFTAGGIDELKAHAADHLSGGSAEVDGDKLDIDFNPSNYTPATTPSEVDSIDNLAAHLYGLDQRVAAASQDARGTIELATHPEAQAGTATGLAVTPSALTAVLKQQSWMQGDGYYIGTDKVRARDEDGLNLEDDGGLGIHVADGGAVTVDSLTASKLVASDGSKNLVSVEVTAFETGGAQEIDGDKLDIDYTPSYYTPATSAAEASDLDHLTAHLTGINTALGFLLAASNIDIDTGTETVDSFADTGGEGVVWFYVVIDNDDVTNRRTGQIMAAWDATNDTIEYTETSTLDVGDTSDITLAVDIDSNTVRLRATAGSDNWTVRCRRMVL